MARRIMLRIELGTLCRDERRDALISCLLIGRRSAHEVLSGFVRDANGNGLRHLVGSGGIVIELPRDGDVESSSGMSTPSYPLGSGRHKDRDHENNRRPRANFTAHRFRPRH